MNAPKHFHMSKRTARSFKRTFLALPNEQQYEKSVIVEVKDRGRPPLLGEYD